jgi:hypothetical protein
MLRVLSDSDAKAPQSTDAPGDGGQQVPTSAELAEVARKWTEAKPAADTAQKAPGPATDKRVRFDLD